MLKEDGFSKLLHVNKTNNGEEIYINLISFDWGKNDMQLSQDFGNNYICRYNQSHTHTSLIYDRNRNIKNDSSASLID